MPDSNQEDAKRALESYLSELEERFSVGQSGKTELTDRLPYHGDLSKLTDLVLNLASAMGIRKQGFGHLGNILKRIDHHYPKLRLWDFALELAKLIGSLPLGPKTRLLHRLKAPLPNYSNANEIIEWLMRALDSDSIPELPEFAGGKKATENQTRGFWAIAGHLLEAAEVTSDAPRHLAFDRATPEQRGYLRFIAAKAERSRWLLKIEPRVQPVAAWLYSLQDPLIDAELRRVFHGGAPSLAQVKAGFEYAGVRWRKRASRERIRNRGENFPQIS